MATIKLKSSSVTGNVPSSLAQGEVAICTPDGNWFYGDASDAVHNDFMFGQVKVSGLTSGVTIHATTISGGTVSVATTNPVGGATRFIGTQHLLRSSPIYINDDPWVQNSLYFGHSTGNQPFNWNDPQAAGGVLSDIDSISIAEDDMRWSSILPFDISQVDIQCSVRPGGACTGDDFFVGLYTAAREDCGATNMTLTKVAYSQDLLCQGKYATNDFTYVGNLDKGTLIFIGIGTESDSAAKNAPGLLNVTITQR